uniref:Putative secreted protein n=1 Tax=Anopheles darlingi TaxID=43151 RepID=A0A2M4DRG9_ANODA
MRWAALYCTAIHPTVASFRSCISKKASLTACSSRSRTLTRVTRYTGILLKVCQVMRRNATHYCYRGVTVRS